MTYHLKKSMHAGMLAIVLTIFLLTARVAQAASLTCGAWSIVASPNAGSSSNFLQGVAAISANDVWAVGTYFRRPGINVPARTLTEHWNGTAWSIVKSPNVGTTDNYLYGVAAISTSDVWAVGYNGKALIEHWNGTSWSIISSPNGGGLKSLYGVAALSANNVWAVGASNNNGAVRTLIEHWNGTKWSIVASPNVRTLGSSLSSVAAVSANDVWAVGTYSKYGNSGSFEQTLTEHWNGTKWSVVKSPNVGPSGGNALYGVAVLSASNVWAVGWFSNMGPGQTLTEHWDGTGWSVVESPNVASTDNRLFGVAVLSSSDVWAVGAYQNFEQTLTEHWNGSSWSIVSSPNGESNNSLQGVAAIPASSQVWAVGTYFSNGLPQTLTEFYCS